MTNENPYGLSNDRVAIILEGVPCDAKEEDLVRAGYHSRDEVVKKLLLASHVVQSEWARWGFVSDQAMADLFVAETEARRET